jgi:hypothetical protein
VDAEDLRDLGGRLMRLDGLHSNFGLQAGRVILTRSWHCLSSIFNAADHLRKGLFRAQFQRKRLRTKQFGPYIFVYPFQSVHAPVMRRLDLGYARAGITIGRINGVLGNWHGQFGGRESRRFTGR